MSENGEAKKDELIIRLVTRDPWQIVVDGQVENLNLALAMLAEATRSMEMEWRLGAAREHQAKMLEQAAGKQDISNLLSMNLKNPTRRH